MTVVVDERAIGIGFAKIAGIAAPGLVADVANIRFGHCSSCLPRYGVP
jgi:hypothetical protein